MQSRKRRRVKDHESQPNKRLPRHLFFPESEAPSPVSDTNAEVIPPSLPNIVISQPGNGESLELLPQATSASASSQTSEDWSLKGRDTVGPGDLTVDPADLIPESVTPSTITYSLKLSFNSVNKFGDWAAVDQVLHYNDPKTYSGIGAKARAYIKQQHTKALGLRDLFFRTGKCSILGDNDYKDTHALTSLEDWVDICRALINLWTTKKRRTISLEISQDYFALQTQVIIGEPFAMTIRNEIHNLMRSCDGGQFYIPRAELYSITSRPIVRQIIVEDANLCLGSDEKEAFIERVPSDARRLFLMIIDAKLGMSCLKELLDKGCSDADLPLKSGLFCHASCKADFRSLIRGQGSFMAAEFMNMYEHQELSHHVVVPIYYKDVNSDNHHPAKEQNGHRRKNEKKGNDSMGISRYGDNDDGDAKSKAWCGSGAYSNVYRVNLDPVHHRLSKDRDSDFAVKEFKDRPQRGNSDFNRELRVLDELRHYSEEHIVTHLATWTQSERYYMLFPYAECNLREYMERVTFGGPDNENILWLLKQFCGLAKAIRIIHDLPTTVTSNATVTSNSTPNLTYPYPAQEKKSGWHHDLKPENILYFRNMSSKLGTFRIADFGAGKIHIYRSASVNTASPNGTLTYEPPEVKSEGATSRPYDIWSLGCVFLELLIWAVFGSGAVKTFATQRDDRRFPGSLTDFLRDDAFWQMAVDGRVSLRKSVNDRIVLLREEALHSEWRPFKEVLDLVSRMLEPDRLERIPALNLWHTLHNIYTQRKVDLERFSTSSPRDSFQERGASPLPRLSLTALDCRSPEPPLSTTTSPLTTQMTSLPSRQVGSISGDLLSSSPTYSSNLSLERHQRNSSANSV